METIIKWTNRTSLLAILSLIYWVFIFICITVFDFKVFKENLSGVFFLSILGILALMSGSLVVNIMFNLTKISNILEQRHDTKVAVASTCTKKVGALLFLLFPLLFVFLYLGDIATTKQREKYIVESAQQLIKEHEDTMFRLADYDFSKTYINRTANSLQFLKKIDEHFPNIELIVKDAVDDKDVFLKFDSYDYNADKDKKPRKVHHIFSSSKDERQYLNDTFEESTKDYRFSAYNGFYELYYPVNANGKIIVLYLTDRKSYGNIGS